MAFDVIRHFRDFMLTAPDELTAYAALLNAPDGSPIVGVIPCYCGDIAEGERVLAALRQFGPPVMDMVQPIPFPVMQGLLAAAVPDGNHNYWKSAMLDTMPDLAIQAAIDRANCATSPLSLLVIEYFGGAAGRVANGATAFPHRHLPWHSIIMAQWTDAGETATHREWAQEAERALRPFATKAQLLASLDFDAAEDPSIAFGSNANRLADVKKKYDPENFFRVNQNIRPA